MQKSVAYDEVGCLGSMGGGRLEATLGRGKYAGWVQRLPSVGVRGAWRRRLMRNPPAASVLLLVLYILCLMYS